MEDVCRLVNDKDREITRRAQLRNADERVILNMMRMEMERVKYLIKTYLRTRIAKIEKYLFYIIEKDKAELLSEAEMSYAWNLQQAKVEHFKTQFYDKVRLKLNKMQDTFPDNMITKPNSKQFVFVRFLEDMDLIKMDHLELQEIKANQIYFLQFH